MHEALKPLIDAGWVEELPSSPDELQGLLGIVARRVEEVAGSLRYPDSIFALAYDAVRCSATVVLRAEGIRVKQGRHHELTFDGLHRLGIPGLSDRARYYDDCRRKRARLEYDSAGDVSDVEARDLAAEAARLDKAVRAWLALAHPEFKLRRPRG
jgi:hypothetical protein